MPEPNWRTSLLASTLQMRWSAAGGQMTSAVDDPVPSPRCYCREGWGSGPRERAGVGTGGGCRGAA